jgi:hypothetical protein
MQGLGFLHSSNLNMFEITSFIILGAVVKLISFAAAPLHLLIAVRRDTFFEYHRNWISNRH